MKIFFSYSGLKNTTLPRIDDACGSIGEAINIGRSLNVPSDFTYAIYLSELPSQLERHQRRLREIQAWIGKNNDSLNNSSIDNVNAVRDINETRITQRIKTVSKL